LVFATASFLAFNLGTSDAWATDPIICPTMGDNCATVETVAALKTSTNAPPWVYTSGYTTAGDGGGGILYIKGGCSAGDFDGGSCIHDSNTTPVYYKAHTFPTNVLQWGADATGASDSTSSIQNLAAALGSTSTGGVMYFPPGTFQFSQIVLPDHGSRGAHVLCAGKDVTTLQLNANSYMFATYNYVHDGTDAGAAEINGCTIDLEHLNASAAGIVVEGTTHSRIHDNEIDNGRAPAVEITSKDQATNCTGSASGDYEIIRNVFKNSYGPAVKGFDDGCWMTANGLSDGVIEENIFSANGVGNSGLSIGKDYQVTLDRGAGWEYRGNKSFGSSGCGDLHIVGLGSGVVSQNRFDISGNNQCTGGMSGPIESVVLEMVSSKGFTFSGNSVNDTTDFLPGDATAWDALEIINNMDAASRATVGDNVFANQSSHYSLNAVNYNGTYANSSSPLVAIGNAYGTNVTAPDPANSSNVIIGSDQYLTVTIANTQTGSSTPAYFPISGLTDKITLTQPKAAQLWGQAGTFSVNTTKCGVVVTAPGGVTTYTFRLMINGSLAGLTCTFSGTSTTGIGSGSAIISQGDTVEWKGIQGTGSVAANPTVSLIFVRE
jgi:hypothetical protein